MQPSPVCRSHGIGIVAVFVTLALAAFGTAARAEPLKLDDVEKNLRGIGANLQNSRMRMSRGFAGAEGEEAAEGTTVTLRCCRDNLQRIVEKIHDLEAQVEQLRDHYQNDQNYTALDVVEDLELRVRQIKQGMMHFARAQTKGQAFEIVTSLARPLNEGRNAVTILRNCCPLPVVASEGQGGEPDRAEPDPSDTESEGSEESSGKDQKKKKKES